MPLPRDPELEQFKRSVDLVAYAKSAGYSPRPNEGARGLTVLDHPNRDCVVVGQIPNGPWIYASVPDYAPRTPGEPSEQALARLRQCIDRTKDRGSIAEFVERRELRAAGVAPSVEAVRDCIRAFRANERTLGLGAERSSPVEGPARPADLKAELNRRRYDWTPAPEGAPRETEVDRRLRLWREAQKSLEPRERGETPGRPAPSPMGPGREPSATRSVAAPKLAPERGDGLAQRPKSELAQRRYDWTPAPAGMDALRRGSRGRSGGPER